jgi:2-polyprenyl-6-methoxyphenol hydroxylase-like FAD-dependent oxidoreductase
MRVLIVGGGVAGLALAAMLARQGREPVVVERASSYEESGYAIALYPLGSAVLHGIGAYPAFAAASAELRTYEIAGRRGGVIRSVDLARLMAPYGGWTWWGRAGIFRPGTVRELWLPGALFGVYPAPGWAMYLIAVPSAATPADGLSQTEVMARLRAALGETAAIPDIGAALDDAGQLWPWRLSDVRSRRLRKGRVVLCGDAGTAFLPTAGVRASAALRSAAALADELSRADARLVPLALHHYLEPRQGRSALTSATPAVWPARCSCKATCSAGAATWPPATCRSA